MIAIYGGHRESGAIQVHANVSRTIHCYNHVGPRVGGKADGRTPPVDMVARPINGQVGPFPNRLHQLARLKENVIRPWSIGPVKQVANILDEWLSLATYCEHTDQIEKVAALKPRIVRGLAMPDSLYLKL